MYKYDLHSHSSEGSACGQRTIEEMIRHFKALGFAGIAITNHFIGGNTSVDRRLPWEELIEKYAVAYTKGQALAKELDFDLLFGIEQGYGSGKEFLAYGFEPDFLTARPFLRHAGVEVWAEEIHSVGGFIAYAHPFRDRGYISDPDLMPDMSIVDGFEAYNYCNTPKDNEKAVTRLKDTGKTMIAGGDLHIDTFTESSGIETESRIKTNRELADVLLSRNFRVFHRDCIVEDYLKH